MPTKKDDGPSSFWPVITTFVGALMTLGVGFYLGREVQRSDEDDEYEQYERSNRDRSNRPSSTNEVSAPSPYPNSLESSLGQSEETDDEAICKVCYDQKQDCVLLPCRHQCVCSGCATKLSECPICRKRIDRVLRVFRS